MKIIKHGVAPEKNYRFACPHCGCVFELTENEYHLHRFVNTDFSTMKIVDADFFCCCPDCGRIIMKKGLPV